MRVTFDNLIDKEGKPITVETALSDKDLENVIQFAKESGVRSAEQLKEILSAWIPKN